MYWSHLQWWHAFVAITGNFVKNWHKLLQKYAFQYIYKIFNWIKTAFPKQICFFVKIKRPKGKDWVSKLAQTQLHGRTSRVLFRSMWWTCLQLSSANLLKSSRKTLKRTATIILRVVNAAQALLIWIKNSWSLRNSFATCNEFWCTVT